MVLHNIYLHIVHITKALHTACPKNNCTKSIDFIYKINPFTVIFISLSYNLNQSTMNIKRIIPILMLLCPALVWGQSVDNQNLRSEKNLNRLVKMYNLTPEQSAQAKDIFKDFRSELNRLQATSRSEESKKEEQAILVKERKDSIYSILDVKQKKKMDRINQRAKGKALRKQNQKPTSDGK